jgi:hypothetical protein
MDDSGGIRQYADNEIEMRFEPLEVTPELLMKGLAVWGAPIPSGAATRLMPGIRELFESPWTVWAPTIRVTQISISTEPNPFPTPWTPPEVTWARVSILGLGWEPGAPVITKWNNAFGFPDNGEGTNSIKLQTPIPDQSGHFAFQTLHRGVPRPRSEWQWEANKQLVIVAYQGPLRMASQPHIPPHVLWQWIPYEQVVSP